MNPSSVAVLDSLEQAADFQFPLSIPRRTSEEKALPAPAEQLLRGIVTILDTLILRVIRAQSAPDFQRRLMEAFPKYAIATRAFSGLAQIVLSSELIEGIPEDAFREVEKELLEKGLEQFGTEVRDQAIFTVWTFRKIWDVSKKFSSQGATPKADEAEMFRKLGVSIVIANFHLDCLVKSMTHHQPIHPDVLPEIIEGMRTAVNAYAWARRILAHRLPEDQSLLERAGWDQEDQDLLNEANLDFAGLDAIGDKE